MIKKTLLALVFVFLPSIVFAHATGFFIEKASGDYFYDVGYSTQFVAGDFVRFDFLISKLKTKELIPFTDAWVRIAQEGKLIFAGPIAYGEFGKPGFSFVFPEAGKYSLSIRFENGATSIAEETFPIDVAKSTDSKGSSLFIWPVISLIAGLVGGFLGAKLLNKYE